MERCGRDGVQGCSPDPIVMTWESVERMEERIMESEVPFVICVCCFNTALKGFYCVLRDPGAALVRSGVNCVCAHLCAAFRWPELLAGKAYRDSNV